MARLVTGFEWADIFHLNGLGVVCWGIGDFLGIKIKRTTKDTKDTK